MKEITKPVLNEVIINNVQELELAKTFLDVPEMEFTFPLVLQILENEPIGYDFSAPLDLLNLAKNKPFTLFKVVV